MSDIPFAVSIFLAAVSSASQSPPPSPYSSSKFCIPATAKERLEPHWLTGDYKIVGLDGATGAPYSGSLRITEHGHSLKLHKQVGKELTVGTGSYVRCGSENRLLFLRVTYNTRPIEQVLLCNAPPVRYQQFPNRVVCSSGWETNGSEAWFEVSAGAL